MTSYTHLFGGTRQHRLSSAAAVQQIWVGALSPMPSCLGIGGHPSGSWQGHPGGVPVIGKIADENGKVDIIINSSCDGKVLETTVNELKVECERAQKIIFQVRLALLPKRRRDGAGCGRIDHGETRRASVSTRSPRCVMEQRRMSQTGTRG